MAARNIPTMIIYTSTLKIKSIVLAPHVLLKLAIKASVDIRLAIICAI
jgi:hypothetical protein